MSAVVVDFLDSGEEVNDELIEIFPLLAQQHQVKTSQPAISVNAEHSVIHLDCPRFVVFEVCFKFL